MSNAAPALVPSELVLGRYRPLRPLGAGGSGHVWLARDEQNGLEVALKIVPREGKAASRAEREAEAAARLRHERCLRAYAFESDSRNVYIAYEYVAGKTLREAMRAGEVDDPTAIESAVQVLEGLAHAHARGIVHRDVKPSNVMLADGPRVSVRLLDFGLARIKEAHTITASGDVPGTLAYISPERLKGSGGAPAADVWAVGVMLWEALAGFHPFWTSSLVETAKAIEQGAPPLAAQRPDLPQALLVFVDAALALDPARRPRAAELAEGIRHSYRARRGRKPAAPARARAKPILRAPRIPVPDRAPSAALAAVAAGWTASALPFFPGHFPLGLAALAAGLTLVRERLGLAAALAVPLFPLGNISLGLAIVYAAAAVVVLALAWREPRAGLFVALGPLLAPVAALGLLPLAAQTVRSPVRRAVATASAVLLAAVVAGVRHASLPFTEAAPPLGLGLAASDSPTAVGSELWRVLAAHPALGIEALVLAAAAAAIPFARGRGLWGIAGLGAALLAATVLPFGPVAALPLAMCTWVTCSALALRPRA
ncbi:MAG TPA: serine/threonine-protein kinase [Gaiellaceae bacterium]